ncbi:hypothetical protein HU200_009726 [Digitaria exilis]|uniref:Inosine/uridine-preferring nucleoside hydrolase domain-containing protein n=1 Tax=Digitaria exilis TaxID=1010633 RepID=A0A835KP32_9POAL|nr:hypothetical protein HU200_009726 [Digitaria exilis]
MEHADDAMAILVALRSPELEVIGLTTTFGNVHTPVATRNALHLKDTKLRIASSCHGSDGLGNQDSTPATTTKPVEQSAAAFLVEQANLYPGQVTIVALGPLTNLALALELDPSFPKKIRQIIVLGGAYSVNGNVNPAAESNIFGDPDAADIIFTCGADVLAMGINITQQVILSGVYLHDPTALLAAVNPSLMTYAEGVVRVQTTGITRGLTLFKSTQKWYLEMTAWSGMPTVKVVVTVDATVVVQMMMQRLMADD